MRPPGHRREGCRRSCSRTDNVSAQLRRRRAAARRSRGRSGMPDSGFRSIEHDPGRLPPEINTSVAHPARRYDYWLGGKDNFPADREAGEAVAAVFPSVRIGVLENRRFMCRVVRFLARELGIRQFLDIGTGIPTSPNVHEVVQAVDPASRVVYVDNDPIVLVHARALLTSSPEGATAYIDADLREPEKILNHPDLLRTLDLSQPTGLLLVAILHFIMDADDPYGVVGRLVGAMPSGSHLVVSHVTADPCRRRCSPGSTPPTPRPGSRSGSGPGRSSPASWTGWSPSPRGSSPSRSGGPRTSPSLARPSRTRRPMAPSRGSLDPPRPRPWRARKPSPSSSGWSSASAWTSHSPCRSACGPLMPPAERAEPRRGIVASAPEQHVRNEQLRARSRVHHRAGPGRSARSLPADRRRA